MVWRGGRLGGERIDGPLYIQIAEDSLKVTLMKG